jgi:hypothetical protein
MTTEMKNANGTFPTVGMLILFMLVLLVAKLPKSFTE